MVHHHRIGIAAGGNWIVDRMKMIDRLPSRGMLANIRAESLSTGGAPANVLVDLSRMRAAFPLVGLGVVGDDPEGRLVLETCRRHGINAAGLVTACDAPTSYTDVMFEESTGDRSFFHCRGANALFGPEHVNADALTCRIFHFGYLLLLDRMDGPDSRHGTVAAGFLRQLRRRGIKTSVDVVSEDSDRFATIVPPALRYVDYLILNEIEAGRAVGRTVRSASGKLNGRTLKDVVERLGDLGDMDLVAVHMPEGVYVRDRRGNRFACGSLTVPQSFIKGKLGAGDAFCAGMLYGLHEGWDGERAARLGTYAATACLSHSSATEGLRPLDQLMELGQRFSEGPPPVKV